MKKLIELDAALDALEKVAELFPWKVPGNRDSYDRYNEAWNDAIGRAEIEIEKLPSAQPVAKDINVPTKDCISRQAAISEIMEDLKDRSLHDDPATPEDYAEGYDEGIRNAAAIVLQMPSAQQERKKGKWIYNSPVTMKCNQCGFVIKDWDWHRFKYCPNCIADMRGENDG